MENTEKPSRIGNTIVRGVSWKLATRVADHIQRLTIGVILARLLAPSDFGLMSMVMVFTGFIGLFRTASFASALIQQKDITEHHISSVFWLSTGTGVLLAVATIFAAPLAASFYNKPMITQLVQAVSITFVFATAGAVPSALLLRRLNFRVPELIRIVSSLSAGGFAIYLVFKGFGVWSLVGQQLAFSSISIVLLSIFCRWRPRFIFSWAHTKECFRFGINLQGTRFVEYFSKNLDNLLIGRYLAAAALGYYDKAYQFMLIPFREVTRVLSQVLYPVFASIQDDHDRIRDTVLFIYRYVGLLVFPAMLGLTVVAPEVILVLYGPKWEATTILLQILCVASLIDSLNALTHPVYLCQGRTDLQFKWNAVSAVIRGTGFAVGLRWGVQGVAVSYVITSLLLIGPSCYIPFRPIDLRVSTLLRNLAPMAFMAGAMGIVTGIARWYLAPHLSDLLHLLICSAIGFFVYAALVMLLQPKLIRDGLARLKQSV